MSKEPWKDDGWVSTYVEGGRDGIFLPTFTDSSHYSGLAAKKSSHFRLLFRSLERPLQQPTASHS